MARKRLLPSLARSLLGFLKLLECLCCQFQIRAFSMMSERCQAAGSVRLNQELALSENVRDGQQKEKPDSSSLPSSITKATLPRQNCLATLGLCVYLGMLSKGTGFDSVPSSHLL